MIPLDDLPELQVGYGFGLVDKETVPKPAYLKDIKLITSANKHRFIVPGGVKQLTKEEFEAFTNQVGNKQNIRIYHSLYLMFF